MKFIWLALIISCSSFADFVYLKEDPNGKYIQWVNDGDTVTLNDTANGLWAIYPDVTTDGREFIFSEGAEPNDRHLTYVKPSKNLTQRFNLPHKGMLLHPKFSKNGRYIFYTAPGPDGKKTIFYFDRKALIASQGKGLKEYSLSNAKALVPSEEAYFPRPSSDANFVVYQRNLPNKKEIVLFDRIENKKTVLAEGMSPALSFDERLIAYTAKSEGNWNIFVVDRFTGKSEQKTFGDKDKMSPAFMPDNTLVFASNKNGRLELFKLKDGKWELLVGSNGDADYYSPQFAGESYIKQGEKAPYLGEPRSSFGTVSHEGKIYMAGGHQGAEHTYPPESFSDQFLTYDIASNTWTELAPRPVKAHGYQLAANGNYIYAFGGFAYSPDHRPRWKSLNLIHRYDIKANKWEHIGNLLEPRSSNVAVTIDGKVYLAGGWNSTPKFENDLDGKFHDTIEIFDLKTEKISKASYPLPAPKRRALTGVNLNGKLLLIGGISEGASHFDLLNKVTSIDPVTGEAKELPQLPFATFAPAAEIIGDHLYVFGGMFKTGPMNYEYVSHIYGLNLKTGKWRHTGRYLQETKGFSQVFKLSDQSVGILGGHRYFEGKDSPVSTFETFSHRY